MSLSPGTVVVMERLAALERPPGSGGEHEAARLIANELQTRGARVRLEAERVHGTYWDSYHAPSNYHWQTDTPENVCGETVAQAARLAEAFLRRVDGQVAPARPRVGTAA